MSDDTYGQPFRDPPRPSTPESYRSIGPAFEKLCHASKEQNKNEPEQNTSSESQSQCPPTPNTPISPPTSKDLDSDCGDFCCARPLVFNDSSQDKSKPNSNQNQNQGSDMCQDSNGGKSLKNQASNECESGESASLPICPNCGFGGAGGGGNCSFPEPELGKCQAIKIDWDPSLSKKSAECTEEEMKPKAKADQIDCEEKPPECDSKDQNDGGKASSQKTIEECLNTDDDIFSRNRKLQPSKPAPQLCEKFKNFAKGIPDPDPKPSLYDDRRGEVYDCIMSSRSDKEEDEKQRRREADMAQREGEDENAAKIRYRINSMTSICPLTDSTKSEKFEAPGEGFRCPPMPNNVPLLMAPVYLQKPNEITVPAYPAPPGVKIQPMIKGIRTNRERNPHCFTCGAKRKPIPKKCFSKNCPAIKTAQPCSKPNEVTSSIKGMVGELRKTVENLTGFKW